MTNDLLTKLMAERRPSPIGASAKSLRRLNADIDRFVEAGRGVRLPVPAPDEPPVTALITTLGPVTHAHQLYDL